MSNVLAEGVALVVYAMFGLGSGRVGYGVLLAVAALPLLAGARWCGWALGATGVGRSPEHLEHRRARQSST